MRNTLFTKCISMVLVIALLMGFAVPVFATSTASADDRIDFVALGDAMTQGVGLDDPEAEAYYMLVAQWIAEDKGGTAEDADCAFHGNKRFRVEELRYLLDDTYNGDGYTASVSGLSSLRKAGTVKSSVKNAEKLVISAGINNFSTYFVEQLMYYLENDGAVKYSYSFEGFADEEVTEALETAKKVVMEQLLDAAPDEGDAALELIEFGAEIAAYAYLSYMVNFNAMVNKIYELNPDVDLYILGIYNPASGNTMTYNTGDKVIDANIGMAIGAVVELANVYAQILAPRAFDYTYVDPATPELLIDQMGNTNLSVDERIPVALKTELLYSVEDTAVSMIQEMFAEYGIDKSYDEALTFAEDIFYMTDPEDRRDYVRNQIQGLAVDEVIARFEEKLEDYASTYGNIDVTADEITALLNALEAALNADERNDIATDFVVDLMTKAMVGQTIAGIYIETQQDAYDAIEQLESISVGDTDALRQAAADMIMQKVDENGLGAFISDDDVVALLEALDKEITPAGREQIVDNWMHDLAVEKIVTNIQKYVPGYTVEMADAMLAKMAAAPEAKREAIAKEHLLKDGFHQTLVDGFESAYADGGLTLHKTANGGFDSFEAFVTAVEKAETNEAAQKIFRDQIRLDAVYKVAETAQGGVTVNVEQAYGWFETVDALATEAEKKAALKDYVYAEYDDPNITSPVWAQLMASLSNSMWDAYKAYNDAATKAEGYVADYRDGVDLVATACAEYVSLRDTAADQILDAYEDQYQGAGATAQQYYNDYIKLRNEAVEQVLKGYDEYDKAINKGLDSCDQLNEDFDAVFSLMCEIAELDAISLNDLLSVAKKFDANYVSNMVENLVQGDEMASEDKTVAYLALRYYLANGMMIMPSANGHNTIAKQIYKAINGEKTNSTAGALANKIIDKTVNLYHAANAFLEKPTTSSGQVDMLINPRLYVALGDGVTAGAYLDDPSMTYVDQLGNALAMVDDGDRVCNYALQGMRTEELLMLLDDTYNGDAYTAGELSHLDLEALRDAYREDITNADLITVQVGINNLTSFPMTQVLRVYNGMAPYEMDWTRYFSETNVSRIAKGKDAVMDLVLGVVDNNAKCEKTLNMVSTALESLVYGMIGYVVNLDASVEAIAEMNEDATIVLVGFHNPMLDTYINVESIEKLSEYTIDTSALTGKVISLANRYLAMYCPEDSRCVNVDVRDTTLNISDYPEISTDLTTLALFKTITVKGKTIDFMVPEYLLEAVKNTGDMMMPNAEGQTYIYEQILNALKYNFRVDVTMDDATKYYGDADPEFTYTVDDLPYNRTLEVTPNREAGENVGTYEISAIIGENDFLEVDIFTGTLTILPRPATITLVVENGVASADIQGILENEIEALNVQITLDEDGRYVITYDETVAANYDLTVIDGQLSFQGSITKKLWTMSLDEVIYLNYYVNLNGFPENYDFANKGGVVIWTGDKAPTSGNQLYIGAENCQVIPGMFYNEEYGWGVKTDEIYAKNLGDRVYLRVYVEVGNGEYVYADKAAYYSPEMYCRDQLKDTGNARYDTRRVCAALLEYGASAQIYFGYRTDALVNAGLDLTEYNLAFDASYLDPVDKPTVGMANTLTGIRAGISYVDGTIDLQGAIRANVYYNIDPSVIDWSQVETAEVLFWSEEAYNKADSLAYELGNYTSKATLELGTYMGKACYTAQSHHIFAQDLSDSLYYSCRIVMKDGTVYRSGLGYYSPEQFVQDHLNNSEGQILDVCERIAVYSEMARQRFLEN